MSDATAPPLLQPDAVSRPFWEACRRRELHASECADCAYLFLPLGPCCPRCWSSRVAPRAVSGRGRVFSFVVYRRTYHAAMPAPYVVALVELQEGPRLISNIVGCAIEEVEIDMPVRVRFEQAGDFMLPRFERDSP